MIECALKLFSYEKLFSHLVNLDKSYKLPSNILLQGQEGIGKTTLLYILLIIYFLKMRIPNIFFLKIKLIQIINLIIL